MFDSIDEIGEKNLNMNGSVNDNNLSLINNSNNDIINNLSTQISSPSDDQILIRICESYEDKMRSYMTALPHIPPTLFELKNKHGQEKNNASNQLLNAFTLMEVRDNKLHFNHNTKQPSIKMRQHQLKLKLDQELEVMLKRLVKENHDENRRCQLGFVLGWKSYVK